MRIQLPLVACLLLSAACSSGDPESQLSCDEDQRDENYVAGIARLGDANYSVSLLDATPSPPSRGDNNWLVQITDPEGNKISGLVIDLHAVMVDHDHTSPVKPRVSDEGDGVYSLDPVNLFMPGLWEISIALVDPGETSSSTDDVDLDTVLFKFCVEG